jgi:hypothetical protein
VLGPVPSDRGLRFDGVDDRVVTLPSASLSELGGVRVAVSGRLRAGGTRRTLVEGYLAFALQIEADGGLSGFVYAESQWRGVASPPGEIAAGRWFDAEFVYDGRDTFLLTLDGRVVAHRAQSAGSIGSPAWPFGLTIGAWPDGDRRCFAGELAAVRVSRLT